MVWIDASQSSNVSIKGEIANHLVETIVTSDGRFLGIQEGTAYHEGHLLIAKDSSDSERGTIQSIPIVLIQEIQTFEKLPLLLKKRSSREGTLFKIAYPDGATKTVRIIERNGATD